MSRLAQWERLTCPWCPSTRFYEAFHIKWHPTNGTSREPAGVVCRECNNEIDMQQMIQKKQLELKKAELAAMQAEIDETTPAGAGVAASGPAPASAAKKDSPKPAAPQATPKE